MDRTARTARDRALLAAACALLAAGCRTSSSSAESGPPPEPRLFDGMGPHRRTVSTKSAGAQAWFDQGLTWAYAFNHDEAARSFERAAEIDPSLAIAWWGVSLVHGPHINNATMSEESSRRAWEALEKARAARSSASPVEQDLIDALGARYAWPVPESRAELDRAYAAAMEKVHRKHPGDLDVATLYAESLMDLQPWDLWTHAGEPKGRTLEIVEALEKILAASPRHPGAAHLYIHAVEASKNPERGIAAADALRSLVPISGHLSHMPSHIDVRVGRWPEAVVSNRRAVAADAKYRTLSPRQGFYRIYMLHNQQFLSFACMMLGRSEEAIAAAKAALATLPADWVKENASLVDGYMTPHVDALKRFGRWDDLLAMEAPPEHLPYTTAMWRAARTVSFAALGQLEAARVERERFAAARKAVPEGAMAQINPAKTVLALAAHVVDGEIAYAERDYAKAEKELRAAIEIEDALVYMEPPDWMQPVRHTLGAVLLDAGRPADAEKAYREDLADWPNNGWSLLGLTRALEAKGDAAGAADARARLERAWAESDVKPHASCLCAPKVASKS